MEQNVKTELKGKTFLSKQIEDITLLPSLKNILIKNNIITVNQYIELLDSIKRELPKTLVSSKLQHIKGLFNRLDDCKLIQARDIYNNFKSWMIWNGLEKTDNDKLLDDQKPHVTMLAYTNLNQECVELLAHHDIHTIEACDTFLEEPYLHKRMLVERIKNKLQCGMKAATEITNFIIARKTKTWDNEILDVDFEPMPEVFKPSFPTCREEEIYMNDSALTSARKDLQYLTHSLTELPTEGKVPIIAINEILKRIDFLHDIIKKLS